MREIKFRIFLAGKFYYWGFVKSHFPTADYDFAGIPDTNADNLNMQEKMLRSQQFTGLHDKNGKEIYEGDILSISLPHDYRTFKAIMEWQAGSFWFRGLDYNMTDCNWHHYNAEDREVIGNIYSNPELLK